MFIGIRANLSRPFYIMLGAVILSFAAFLVWVAMGYSRKKDGAKDFKGKRKGGRYRYRNFFYHVNV